MSPPRADGRRPSLPAFDTSPWVGAIVGVRAVGGHWAMVNGARQTLLIGSMPVTARRGEFLDRINRIDTDRTGAPAKLAIVTATARDQAS